MGLGVHGGGVGVAAWAAKHGSDVLVTDMKTRKELSNSIKQLAKYKKIKYRLGKHTEDDFKNIDIVVANPIIRQDNKFLTIARKYNTKIYNDVSLFMDFCPCEVIGITGTKGKSTTASLVYNLLKGGKRKVYLGGNIRISPFSFLDRLNKDDLVILEISSWQCEGLASIKKSPHISLLTNLGIDHLNTYKSFAAYAQAKALLFKYQGKDDYAILNKQDKYSQKLFKNIKSNKLFFNIKSKSNNYILNNHIYYINKKILPLSDLKLIGKHNYENILAALTIGQLFNVSIVKVKQILSTFKTLAGRMEKVRLLDNILYINDTTATAPLPVISTINAIASPIILIAGGNDKKLDLDKLAKIIIKRINFVALLPGSATDYLIKFFKKEKFVDYKVVMSMTAAVILAKRKAISGDTILLSPGATSFGLFVNEFDRGDKFIKVVKELNKWQKL